MPRPAPTAHPGLLAWVEEVRALVRPAAVRWCDGSQAEHDACLAAMVASGAAIPLDPARRPGSYLFRSHPSDVARIEDRTFIAARSRADAGPTNNWIDPAELKRTMAGLYAGCMAGRTMYVVPFAMGPIASPLCRIGVQITDSPYVVASMRIMTRMGAPALRALGDAGAFVPCLHSVGSPLRPGEADGPWPCAPIERKYIAHFPEERLVWSFGSGYGGNALLGKKCLALRIASVMARDEGWLAEHMLILALTSPQGRTRYIAAAFPSACGKTNLAMLSPSLPGWTVRVLGDDIAWMRIGADGSLRAVNPEAGFFGVAPGTSARSNPNAMAMLARGTLFTNCALTGAGDVWWEGMGEPPPAPGIDWQGRPWSPEAGRPAAHPNARFTVPAANCPVLDPQWDDPEGVPISAILFGGRRPATIPLVNEALSWEHGVFMGSSTGSETTAANLGQAGILRRDPFAMLPFCGYHMGDYFAHWLAMGRRLGAAAPRVFFVNWFRRDGMGRFLWPGFGDNVRVLKYVVERIEGADLAVRTPIGLLPRPGALDVSGLDLPPERLAALLAVDLPGWREEAASVRAFYDTLGDRLPPALDAELSALQGRLGAP